MSVRIARATITEENVLRSWVAIGIVRFKSVGNVTSRRSRHCGCSTAIWRLIHFPSQRTGQKEDIQINNWFVNSEPKARNGENKTKNSLSISCQRELMACKPLFLVLSILTKMVMQFRWVFCQLDRLRRCIVSGSGMPWTNYRRHWTRTYEHIIGMDKEIGRMRIVCFNACGHTPSLYVEELAEFLAFEFEEGGTPIFQADCRLQTPRDRCSLHALVWLPSSWWFWSLSCNSLIFRSRILTSTRIEEGRVPRYYTPSNHPFPSHAGVSFDSATADDQITEEPWRLLLDH